MIQNQVKCACLKYMCVTELTMTGYLHIVSLNPEFKITLSFPNPDTFAYHKP